MGSGRALPLPARFIACVISHLALTQGFWLGETTVTQSLWRGVMGDNPSHFQSASDEDLPVENVSWDDCAQFFVRVAELAPGLELTFPSEAQWEYACRAGTTTPFSTGQNLTTDQANYDGNHPYANAGQGIYRGKTVAVRAFAPNRWGLYQMHGNVWEWCLDGLREYSAEAVTDPLGELNSPKPVVRGGSWFFSARCCRCAFRNRHARDFRNDGFGLRAALVPSDGERDARHDQAGNSERPERSQAGER
jgi:formylglycine-generating enzyme required for sulfatase activity